jgi:hypothetical protein
MSEDLKPVTFFYDVVSNNGIVRKFNNIASVVIDDGKLTLVSPHGNIVASFSKWQESYAVVNEKETIKPNIKPPFTMVPKDKGRHATARHCEICGKESTMAHSDFCDNVRCSGWLT